MIDVYKRQHESGTLHRVMTVFATGGLNLMKLESRPIPGRSWEYRFFADFTGDLAAYGMDSILREMSQCAATPVSYTHLPPGMQPGK